MIKMDCEKILARMAQLGTVMSVNRERHTARVKFPDTGIISDWLFVIRQGDWMPEVGEMVLALYLPVKDSDGFILGGI